MKRCKCDQCQVVAINGIPCHERGCPNSWIDPATGEAYSKECLWCGSQFMPTEKWQKHCDQSCYCADSGFPDPDDTREDEIEADSEDDMARADS